MKIGIIQASSQKDKNELLYKYTKLAVEKYGHEVINFGVFPDDKTNYSYIETAINISLLLSSKAVDFIVSGCSSGQGMMLACNSLPDVLCGYIPTPQDAYLFGRINDGNCASFPLGLNFGWSGEINLQCTLEKLFDGPFGTGYPPKDSERKKHDTILLKQINIITKSNWSNIIDQLDKSVVEKALTNHKVVEYILSNGTNTEVLKIIEKYTSNDIM